MTDKRKKVVEWIGRLGTKSNPRNVTVSRRKAAQESRRNQTEHIHEDGVHGDDADVEAAQLNEARSSGSKLKSTMKRIPILRSIAPSMSSGDTEEDDEDDYDQGDHFADDGPTESVGSMVKVKRGKFGRFEPFSEMSSSGGNRDKGKRKKDAGWIITEECPGGLSL
ncbi:hypothetical protein vseg_003362 [Gypsophila vaccaria]